jgi:hypothetical protein
MDIAQIVLVAGLVIFMIVRRFAGQPLQAKSMLIPLALTVWGGYQMRGDHFSAPDVAFLAISVLLGLAAGAARGVTIKIFTRDGHLWQRYRLATLGVWVALILVRLGMSAGAHRVGIHLDTTSTVLMMSGVSLIAETVVVSARAARTGIPYAPSRRRPAASYR